MPGRRQAAGASPRRGEVWFANLIPTIGREQQGDHRPVLIVSVDRFNLGPAELVYGIPITTTERNLPTHVRIVPPESGATEIGYIMCEAMRSLSKERMRGLRGSVSAETMDAVEERIRILLGLDAPTR